VDLTFHMSRTFVSYDAPVDIRSTSPPCWKTARAGRSGMPGHVEDRKCVILDLLKDADALIEL